MERVINISPQNYENWLKLVFGCTLANGAARDQGLSFGASDPQRLLAHFARLCRDWNATTEPYTQEQVSQGVWFLFSSPIMAGKYFKFGQYLADVEIPVEVRIECVRAMLHPYADFVAGSKVGVMQNCFDMWWDTLCSDFWRAQRNRLKADEVAAERKRTWGAKSRRRSLCASRTSTPTSRSTKISIRNSPLMVSRAKKR